MTELRNSDELQFDTYAFYLKRVDGVTTGQR